MRTYFCIFCFGNLKDVSKVRIMFHFYPYNNTCKTIILGLLSFEQIIYLVFFPTNIMWSGFNAAGGE